MTARAVERRIVTVLFADLVGFTTLSEQLDAEDVALVQDAYFGAARETITRHGGQLEKFVGDAVMAVFGVPRSRDDDAERAVRAGLALIAAVERLGGSLGLEPDALRLRVGVNTGETVYAEASAERGPVTGDTVNVAARLQAAALPGTVIVGGLTGLAVAEAIELEELPPLELKGKAEPVRAWRAVDVLEERSRERALGGIRAPTLGREDELEQLTSLLGETARIVVVAPPGVGKTRLLAELAAAAGEHAAIVLSARLRPDVLSPFDPVAQLLHSAGGERTLVESLARRGIAPARARVIAGLLAELGTPGSTRPTERDQLFAAWLEGLDAVTSGRSALWLVEDVHWASPDLLAFLEFAGRQPHPDGRLVVTTARPVVLESAGAWVAGGTWLDLPPLREPDAVRLVRALVGDALPDELVVEVAARSGGNPLFVEELLRLWASAGVLVAEGDAWRLATRADEVPLPPTVQAIYAGQLDDLPAGARLLVRRASVAGRRFPTAAFAPLGVADPEPALASLGRRALLAGPLTDPTLGESYAYRHALLRDAGYASLARGERARLHLCLADWLVSLGEHVRSALAEVIARHYAAALSSAPALVVELDGKPLEAISDAAADWFERASAIAAGFAAWDSATRLAARSVELTRDGRPIERGRRLHAQATATMNAVGVDPALELAQEAVAELRRGFAGDPDAARAPLADAGSSLGGLLRSQTLFNAAEAVANELLDELGGPDDAAVARLLTLRASSARAARDEFEPALADATRALRLARAYGDPAAELEALQVVAMIEHEEGLVTAASWEAVSHLAETQGRVDVVQNALTSIGSLYEDDDPPAALSYYDRAIELARAHGLVEPRGWSEFARCEALFSLGDWELAVDEGLQVVAFAEEHDFHRLAVRTWFALLPIARARGRRDLVEQAFPRFEARRGVEPDSGYAKIVVTSAHLAFAEFGLEEPFCPDVEARRASFEQLDHAGASWLAAVMRVIESWLAAGELDGAERSLDRMRARLGSGAPSGLAQATEAILRSRVANARDDRDAAVDSARRALALTGSPWWRLQAIEELSPAGAASHSQLAEADAIRKSLGLAG